MKTDSNEQEILLVNFIKKMEKKYEYFLWSIFLCYIIVTIIYMNCFMIIKFEILSLIIISYFLLLSFYILYKIEVKFSKKQIKQIIGYELKNFDGVLIFNIDKTVKKENTEYMYLIRNLYKTLKITEPDFDFYLTFKILRNNFEIKIKVPEKYMENDKISFISSDDFKKYFLPFMNL